MPFSSWPCCSVSEPRVGTILIIESAEPKYMLRNLPGMSDRNMPHSPSSFGRYVRGTEICIPQQEVLNPCLRCHPRASTSEPLAITSLHVAPTQISAPRIYRYGFSRLSTRGHIPADSICRVRIRVPRSNLAAGAQQYIQWLERRQSCTPRLQSLDHSLRRDITDQCILRKRTSPEPA